MSYTYILISFSHLNKNKRYITLLYSTHLQYASVSVYYVAVRTIVLSRYGSNLAKPVIIHDIIHSLMCQVLHIVDFLGSRRMETAPTSIEVLLRPTQSQSDEPSDLRGSLSPTTRHRCTHVLVYLAPGSPRRSPIQFSTGRNVA